MKQISEELGRITDPTQRGKTSNELPAQSQTHAVSTTRRASIEEVGKAIAYAEKLKQIKPLTDPQRRALQIELDRCGWTKEELARRARSVAGRDTFGTIAYEYWVKDILLPFTEIERLATFKAEKLWAQRALKEIWNVEVTERDAIDAFMSRYEPEYERLRKEEVEKAVRKQRERVDAGQKRIEAMNKSERMRLLSRATKRKIFEPDKEGNPDWLLLDHMTMPFIVHKLLPLLEETGKPKRA